MDEGIRSGKTLSLGMPRHPKVIFKYTQDSKHGDAPDGIPSLFYQPSVNYLELYFYSSHDMGLLGASCAILVFALFAF